MINQEIVLNATGTLISDLISDFVTGTQIKVIAIRSFNNVNKTFVTIEDINFIPERGRPEKRCTVHLETLDESVVINL